MVVFLVCGILMFQVTHCGSTRLSEYTRDTRPVGNNAPRSDGHGGSGSGGGGGVGAAGHPRRDQCHSVRQKFVELNLGSSSRVPENPLNGT